MRTILNPGGHLALGVPNPDRLWDPYRERDYPPNHLTRWTVSALEKFITGNGFTIVEMKVKTLSIEDLTGVLRPAINFICNHWLLRNRAATDAADGASGSGKGRFLFWAREIVMRGLVFPLNLLFRILRLPGKSIYCLARLK